MHEITVDLSLTDASVRLAKELPSLELGRMSGRISARFPKTGFVVKGQNIELETRPKARARAGLPMRFILSRPISTSNGSLKRVGWAGAAMPRQTGLIWRRYPDWQERLPLDLQTQAA